MKIAEKARNARKANPVLISVSDGWIKFVTLQKIILNAKY
jgi:hypothetical protein